MKAKKLLILLLAALIALFSLCACGDETKGDPDKSGSVDDSYAASSDETQDSGESSGSSLNDNYFQSSVML